MINRRKFMGEGLALGALAYLGTGCKLADLLAAAGIEAGAISYSFRDMPMYPGSTIDNARESGVKSLELMSYDLERDAGAPITKLPWLMTKDEKKALLSWRAAAKSRVFEAVRKAYDAAGISVHIVKYGDITGALKDHELSFRFEAARIMGAKCITCELPNPKTFEAICPKMIRLNTFAARYGIDIAFHNHKQVHATTYDGPVFGWGEHFKVNFDIGNYTAANNDNAMDVVRKYRDHIFSIHMKDRTSLAHGSKDARLGEGDAPIRELIAFMRAEKLTWPCDIEMEYKVPADSSAVKEVAACRAWIAKA